MSHRHILYHVCLPNGKIEGFYIKFANAEESYNILRNIQKAEWNLFQWFWRRVRQLFGKWAGIAVMEKDDKWFWEKQQ